MKSKTPWCFSYKPRRTSKRLLRLPSRQHNLKLWNKDDSEVKKVRALVYKSYNNYNDYKIYIKNPETAANAMVCLIN